MQRITLQQVRFLDYVKLCVAISTALGIFVGIIASLLALTGFDVNVHLFGYVLTGVTAALAAIPVMSVGFSALGFAIGVVSYLPFRWLLKLMGGVTISAEWNEVGDVADA